MRELGVWRSWLAHLVWDQRVLCSSHSTPTKGNYLMVVAFFCITLEPSTKSGVFVDGRPETCGVVHKKGCFRGRGGKISAFVLKIGRF